MKDRSSKEDILKELFNISIGRAASILSEIVNRKIILNIPDIKLFDTRESVVKDDKHIMDIIEGALMVSSISFKEKLTGKANLIFPADKIKNFISLCLNEEDKNYEYDLEFTDIDFDVIREIGNIILNSLIGEIGNYIDAKLDYTLPEIKLLDSSTLKRLFLNTNYEYILILSITFKIEETEITGAVLINLTLNSLDEILAKTFQMEEELNK